MLNRGDFVSAIVDRIEDGVVTLEINNNYFNIPLEKISKQIKEGDIIEAYEIVEVER